MANIADKIAKIRQAIFGKDIRSTIADGIEAINGEVEDTTQRQTTLEGNMNTLADNLNAAESSRVTSENIRVSNEQSRSTAETNRATEFNLMKSAYEAANHENTVIELTGARHDNINNIDFNDIGERMDSHSAQLNDIAKIIPLSNGIDDTSNIQSIVSQGGNIQFPSGTWYIDGITKINVPSNTHIKMAKDTILKVKPNDSTHYTLFMLDTVKNVSIKGGNLYGERNEHTGTTGEFGFGIWTKNAENILLEDLYVKDFWGDGIVLGSGVTANKNITINRVICDNNRRQGLTVSHVDGLEITNSEFNNTNGTAPSDGIDFEIDTSGQNSYYINNVRIDNVKCKNNEGYGIAFDLRYTASREINIAIDHYYSEQTKGLLFSLGSKYISHSGSIVINNANFSKFAYCPIVFSDWHSLAPTIVFNNPSFIVDETFNYTSGDDWGSLALVAVKDMSITPVRDVGNVLFSNLSCKAKPTAIIKPKMIMANLKPSAITLDNATPVSNIKIINTQDVSGLQQDNVYFGEKVGTGNLFTHIDIDINKNQELTLTPSNGWTGQVSYVKNDIGIVTLDISVIASTTVSAGTLIATLPTGYRIKNGSILVIPVMDFSYSGEILFLKMDSTGKITLTPTGTFVAGRTYKAIMQFRAQ